ncbi:MAG TPA: hypothetical protein VK064_07340 [Wenzhouxiangella sp.]|nr:hypothetical protein [Wenzhouxiangella sp.]
MRKLLAKIILALLLALVLAAPLWAITLDEAARQAARRYDGKVVSARTVERNNRRVHVIRVVTRDDVVRTVRIPADKD